jgi:hypothetical protein
MFSKCPKLKTKKYVDRKIYVRKDIFIFPTSLNNFETSNGCKINKRVWK